MAKHDKELYEDWFVVGSYMPIPNPYAAQEIRECPICGEPLTDPCDPDFCEACFQDFPMSRDTILED